MRALERGAQGLPLALAITNRLGGEDVTHTLVAESAAEAQRWMEAFSQHFYDMSERGTAGSSEGAGPHHSPLGPLPQ